MTVAVSALVVAAQTGDMSAFAELYRRLNPRLRPYLYTLTGDVALTADLAQETWVRVLIRLDRFDLGRSEHFGTWLHTLAHNLTVDYLRSPAARREIPVAETDVYLRDVAESAEELAARRETVAEVRAAVAGLRPAWRRVVYLHDLCGWPVAEVADRFGLSRSTVKSHERRARRSMAATLGGAA